jgi:hypothetical protein
MISSVPMRNFMTLFVLMEEHNVGKAGKKTYFFSYFSIPNDTKLYRNHPSKDDYSFFIVAQYLKQII